MIRVDNDKKRHVTESQQLFRYRSFCFRVFQIHSLLQRHIFGRTSSVFYNIFMRAKYSAAELSRCDKLSLDTMLTNRCLNMLSISAYVNVTMPKESTFRGAKERLTASWEWLKGCTKRFPLRNACLSDIWKCARQVGLVWDGDGRHTSNEAGAGCYAGH